MHSIENSVIEKVFVIIYSWMHMIMVHTELHGNLKNGLWPKYAETAIRLKNIMVKSHAEK